MNVEEVHARVDAEARALGLSLSEAHALQIKRTLGSRGKLDAVEIEARINATLELQWRIANQGRLASVFTHWNDERMVYGYRRVRDRRTGRILRIEPIYEPPAARVLGPDGKRADRSRATKLIDARGRPLQ